MAAYTGKTLGARKVAKRSGRLVVTTGDSLLD
jgi:hypothetical protein